MKDALLNFCSTATIPRTAFFFFATIARYGGFLAPFPFKHKHLKFANMAEPIKIVLVRHGESQWNQENKFTGWTDVPLSEKVITVD